VRPISLPVLFVLVALVLAAIGFSLTASRDAVEATPDFEVPGGYPEQGRLAVMKYGCGGCHTIKGIRTARGKVGPELTTLAERAYIAGNLPNTPDNLVRWIIDPQSIEPGTAMPNLRVSAEDARSIAAYLYRLR
jgi:cytochrome c